MRGEINSEDFKYQSRTIEIKDDGPEEDISKSFRSSRLDEDEKNELL